VRGIPTANLEESGYIDHCSQEGRRDAALLRPTDARRGRLGGQHLPGSGFAGRVLGTPLGRHHEQRPPVRAAKAYVGYDGEFGAIVPQLLAAQKWRRSGYSRVLILTSPRGSIPPIEVSAPVVGCATSPTRLHHPRIASASALSNTNRSGVSSTWKTSAITSLQPWRKYNQPSSTARLRARSWRRAWRRKSSSPR
jgi:hypothetical protein